MTELSLDASYDPRRITGNERTRWEDARYYASRSDHAPLANMGALQNQRLGTDENIILNQHPLCQPFSRRCPASASFDGVEIGINNGAVRADADMAADDDPLLGADGRPSHVHVHTQVDLRLGAPGRQDGAVVDAQRVGAEPVAHVQTIANADPAAAVALDEGQPVHPPARPPAHAVQGEIQVDNWQTNVTP